MQYNNIDNAQHIQIGNEFRRCRFHILKSSRSSGGERSTTPVGCAPLSRGKWHVN